MRADEIRSHVRKQPFRPFRLYLTDGASYEVHHPELIYVSRREVVVALEFGEDDMPERSAYCDPMHITHIEPLDGAEHEQPRSSRT
ncbi:MAG: hypothetical protein JSV78_14560 [Phycisphaerales bacterium]|jgi:hypothetical protein|nr:MAG: hypothetical protein JSV78_14560 [Phycisphaerales bacterium]